MFVLSSGFKANAWFNLLQFDDIKIPETALALQSVPTPYKDLVYIGLSVGAAAPISVAALRPSSLQNFAVYLSLSPAVSISTVFSGSNTTAFDLKSTNAGCYAPTQDGFVAPVCITSQRVCTESDSNINSHSTAPSRSPAPKLANGQKVVSNFKFAVPSPSGIGVVDQPVALHTFPSTVQLKDVAVAISSAVTPNIDGATVQFALDDVQYIAYLTN